MLTSLHNNLEARGLKDNHLLATKGNGFGDINNELMIDM